jgi:hypothetical protein
MATLTAAQQGRIDEAAWLADPDPTPTPDPTHDPGVVLVPTDPKADR